MLVLPDLNAKASARNVLRSVCPVTIASAEPPLPTELRGHGRRLIISRNGKHAAALKRRSLPALREAVCRKRRCERER